MGATGAVHAQLAHAAFRVVMQAPSLDRALLLDTPAMVAGSAEKRNPLGATSGGLSHEWPVSDAAAATASWCADDAGERRPAADQSRHRLGRWLRCGRRPRPPFWYFLVWTTSSLN